MTFEIKVIVFVVASAGIAWVSRAALRDVQSHGFYRFFAWEALLALALLNLDAWFVDPFSVHQIIAWFLLIASLYLVIEGMRLLRVIGRLDSEREDPSLLGLEKTTTLVTVGAYRYIRHPLYSSLLFLGWGIFFKDPSRMGVLLAVAATFFLIVTARKEEVENMRFFGPAYRDYMHTTKMFIPFVF